MTLNSILQISLYLIALLACVKPLGLFMARVYDGRVPTFGSLLSPIERLTYRLCGINKDTEMTWRQYTQAVLSLSVISFVSVYAMQRMQALLPLNPDQLASVSADSSFNTAISFVTNTNWQGYSGETTMSYLTQMAALTVQNFISAAAGMAVLVALIRGFTRSNTTLIGNFWVDLVRGTLYILLPLSVLLADPAMQAPELAASRAEAEHARRVVRGLLGFARPGEEPVSDVDVHALAVASGDRYTPLAEQRDVTIRVDLSVDLSPAGTGAGLHIRAAASAVRQVLDNLVHNAVLASEPGASVDIVVRATPFACVEVRDRGPGLPAAVKARLYEPFVTGRADGTGLGLAVCQRIVRANGGVLEHLPRDGGGLIARWTLAAGVPLHSGESNA